MLCCDGINYCMNTNELSSCGLCGQEIIFPTSHSCLRLDFRWIPLKVTYMKSSEVLHSIGVNRPLKPWTVISTFKQCLDTGVLTFSWPCISVINQIDAQKFCFTISLFHASTCFEHMCSSSGSQICTTQPLVSSHWNKWVV
jgi:hypothetical protein